MFELWLNKSIFNHNKIIVLNHKGVFKGANGYVTVAYVT